MICIAAASFPFSQLGSSDSTRGNVFLILLNYGLETRSRLRIVPLSLYPNGSMGEVVHILRFQHHKLTRVLGPKN
jgi:hypothetical protein